MASKGFITYTLKVEMGGGAISISASRNTGLQRTFSVTVSQIGSSKSSTISISQGAFLFDCILNVGIKEEFVGNGQSNYIPYIDASTTVKSNLSISVTYKIGENTRTKQVSLPSGQSLVEVDNILYQQGVTKQILNASVSPMGDDYYNYVINVV